MNEQQSDLPEQHSPRLDHADVLDVVRNTRAVGQIVSKQAGDITVYTVPLKYMCRGRLFVAEIANAAATYRVAIREDGDALANEHYVVYDAALAAHGTDYSVELLLDETDIVAAYASAAGITFTFLGELEPKDTA